MEGYPFQQESHVMIFERAVDHDVDELYCPICGRRILVQWTPDFKKVVMVAGDETAIHTASKGSVAMSSPETKREYNHEEELTQDEQERLAEWEVMLDAIGFDSWWA